MRTHVIRVAVIGTLCLLAAVGCKRQKPKPPEPDLEFEELRSNLVRAALVNLTNPANFEVSETEPSPQFAWSSGAPNAGSQVSQVATPLAAQVRLPTSDTPRSLAEPLADGQSAKAIRSPNEPGAGLSVEPARLQNLEAREQRGATDEVPVEPARLQSLEARGQRGATDDVAAQPASLTTSAAAATPAGARQSNSEWEPTGLVDERPGTEAQAADAQVAGTEEALVEDGNATAAANENTAAPQDRPDQQEAETQPVEPSEAQEPNPTVPLRRDEVAQRTEGEAEQAMQTEAAVRRAISTAFSALYGAGVGFTGDSAGSYGFTGIGAGPGHTGIGAGPGSTGVGAGPGHTGIGAGPGSTGIGAGRGFTGVTAGIWGSTGIAGSRPPNAGDTTTASGIPAATEREQGSRPQPGRPEAIVWLSPWGPILLPVAY